MKINLDVNLDVLRMFYGLNLGTIAGGHRMSRRTSIGHHSRMSKGCPLNRPVLYGKWQGRHFPQCPSRKSNKRGNNTSIGRQEKTKPEIHNIPTHLTRQKKRSSRLPLRHQDHPLYLKVLRADNFTFVGL